MLSFTFQDECRRLRESIKCGLVRCFTVVSVHGFNNNYFYLCLLMLSFVVDLA